MEHDPEQSSSVAGISMASDLSSVPYSHSVELSLIQKVSTWSDRQSITPVQTESFGPSSSAQSPRLDVFVSGSTLKDRVSTLEVCKINMTAPTGPGGLLDFC